MIFWRLFIVFSKIGIFNFGGGYAMISLIHNEVVEKQAWLTSTEFTDIVAISQSTPGPIGINCATYVGYVSVINAGLPTWMGCIGAFLASLSVMWLPFLLMITLSRYLLTHKDEPFINDIFKALRPTIVGLIAAAAVLLLNSDNFGDPGEDLPMFIISIALFVAAFVSTHRFKLNPILVLVLCGIVGLVVY